MHFRVFLLLFIMLLGALEYGHSGSPLLDCSCDTSSDTLIVKNALDEGPGSLRCAITCANQEDNFSVITFDMEVKSDTFITLNSPLPVLEKKLKILADSTGIHLDGSQLLSESDYALRIGGDSITISGLTIENFPNNGIDNYQGFKAIELRNNRIKNNGRLSPSGDGIDFRMATDCSFINNVISGNSKNGVYLQACEDFVFLGNEMINNINDGIYIYQSDQITLGDSCVNCSNLVSGNFKNGISILTNSSNISISNNIIGLNRELSQAYPNKMNGISIAQSDSIRIGGSEGMNYISGNYFSGIELIDSTSQVIIQNNKIGLSGFEDAGIPNGLNGIRIMNSNLVSIGGANENEANWIGYQPNNIYIGAQSIYCSILKNHFSCSFNGINIEPMSNENIQPVDDFIIEDAYTISGMDEPFMAIQVYLKNDQCITCQGNEFLGSVFSYTGFWEVILDEPLQDGDEISILKTDVNGNSSVFSSCLTFDCSSFDVAILNDQENRLCEGENMVLSTSGGQEFFWSTGETTPQIRIFQGGEYAVTVLNEYGCPAVASINIDLFPSPDLSIIPQDSVTFCGDYTILKAEGQGNFLWNTGVSGQTIEALETGQYCVTLTNIYGCSTSDCIKVTKGDSAKASIEVIGKENFCHGENAQLVAQGGSSYLWSTGEYNQDTITIYQGGNYQVTVVNEFGCEDIASQEINVYPSITASIDPAGPVNICHGDSVLLMASDAYEYAWNNGSKEDNITVDALGIYFVTVVNEYGCSDVASTVVSVNPPIDGAIIPGGPSTFCQGDSLWLFTEGVDLDSIRWNTGANIDSILVSESDVYSVEMFSFGCSIRDSIEVTNMALPVVDSIIGLNWSFPDSMQYFEISNPLPENQYKWTVSGGEFIFNDSTSSVEVIWGDFDLGELCVYAIDDYNCTGLPICKTVDLSTLQLLELESDLINLYPNPSLGMLNLSFEQNRKWEEVLIELYNPLGSRVTTLEFNLEEGEGVKKLDLSFLPEGVYWIKLYTDGKLNSIQKWVLSM